MNKGIFAVFVLLLLVGAGFCGESYKPIVNPFTTELQLVHGSFGNLTMDNLTVDNLFAGNTTGGTINLYKNLLIHGNLTVIEYITAVNLTEVNANGSIIPIFTNTFDLGNLTNLWRDIYTYDLYGDKLYAGDGNVTNPSITFAGDPDTGLYTGGSGQLAVASNGVNRAIFSGNTLSIDAINTLTSVSMNIVGRALTGPTAVGIILDTLNELNTSGAKVLSIRNAGVEKAYIDKDGDFVTGGTITVNGGALDVNSIYPTGATFFTIYGNIADGATAVGTKIGNIYALTIAGAKIASFYSDNVATEEAYIDKDGGYYIVDGGIMGTTNNGNLTLSPNGTGITQVGDAGATSHSFAANDDLFVSGNLEIDGSSYFDGSSVYATGYPIYFGSGLESAIYYNNVQTPNTIMVALPSTSNNLLIAEIGDILVDFGHAQRANPTVIIQSADATNTSQNLMLYHNQTEAVIESGYGGTTLTGGDVKMEGNLSMSGNNITGVNCIVFSNNSTICVAP